MTSPSDGTRAAQPPAPPVAARKPTKRTLHGVQLTDDYAWLRDERWREVMRDPTTLATEIREYLEAENAYLDDQLSNLKGLREELVAEMRGRIKEDDSSVPAPDGAFAYYYRYEQGAQYPRYCRCPAADAAAGDRARTETVLLDCDAEAKHHAFFSVAGCEHSPSHRLYAYAVDTTGSEIYKIRLTRAESGKRLPDEIPGTTGSFVWSNDDAYIFYTVLDDNHRPSKVLRHQLGTPAAQDVLVYEEPDPGFFVSLHATESRRFILIDSHDHTTSEVRRLDADDPTAAPALVAARTPDVEYSVAHHGDRLIILTNDAGAEDFKLVECPLETSEREHWRDVVAHRAGTLIVSYSVFDRFLVRLERSNALPRIVVRDLQSGKEHAVEFEEQAYSLSVLPGYEFRTKNLRFSYSSPTTPAQVFDYDMASRNRQLRKTQEVPSGHDSDAYCTRRLHAKSHDGEMVPITILYHRNTPLDGSAPTLLYGYGAYGHAIPASFSTGRLSLVDRGFIYAIAHVRGGTERGYRWYRDGKLSKKTNTFEDFIAAAQCLIEAGYTRPGRIACHGGSAGGLLIGAVINMRPDLFGAAVGEVPFVDVLNTMCDGELPLTPPEWPEWGNPRASKAAFRDIRAYSPYDNISKNAYPDVLATGGLTDPRVTYWEPAKWVAKLRATRTDEGLTLLRTNMSAGHGGASGRFDRLEETALVYAFVLDRLR